MKRRPALLVFARAPLAGRVKTRLIPALGPTGAAELYRCFLLDTLDLVSQAPADVIVAAADIQHLDIMRPLVAEACPRAELTAQSGGDLGERVANAAEEALSRQHPCVVVIGTDSPSLPLARLREAFERALIRDLVLGPCFDGGYYLIGTHALIPGVFADISWGSDSVLLDTIRRAREKGASVSLLEPWYDVDTAEDLRLLRMDLTARWLADEPIPCPRTWEYLRGLKRDGP